MAKTFAIAALLATIMLIAATPSIHRWERANGYPYGHMCNSVFTLYVDTCKPR